MNETRSIALICRLKRCSTVTQTVHSHLAITLATTLIKTVVVIGKKNSRPNRVKRKSPGKSPKPSIFNHGRKPLMNTSASSVTMSQRIMQAS